MKKKLLFLVPALLGLFLSACNTGSGDSSPSPVTPSSGNTEPGGTEPGDGGSEPGGDPAKSDFTNVSFSSATYTYDGQPHILAEVTGAPEGTTITYTNREEYTNVGTYPASALLQKDGYNDKTLNATLTINSATFGGLTFSNQTVTYDGEDHINAIHLEGELPVGTSQHLVVKDANGNEVTSAVNAGAYNYTLTLSKANYATAVLNAKLTINKANITGISFNSSSLIYDGEPHTLEIEGSLPTGGSVQYSNNGPFTDAGVYQINATVSAPNYNNLNLSATLTIEKSTFTGVTFNDAEFEYDGTPHSIAAVGALPSTATVVYTSDVDGITNTATDIGEYNITATITDKNFDTLVLHAKMTIKTEDEERSLLWSGDTLFFQNALHDNLLYAYNSNDDVLVKASGDNAVDMIKHDSNGVLFVSKSLVSSSIKLATYDSSKKAVDFSVMFSAKARYIQTAGSNVIYYVVNGITQAKSGIYKVDLSSGEPVVTCLSVGKAKYLTLVSDKLYFADGNNDYKFSSISTSGENQTRTLVVDEKINNLYYNNGVFYYTVNKLLGNYIERYTVSGGRRKLTSDAGIDFYFMGGYLYYINVDKLNTKIWGDGIYKVNASPAVDNSAPGTKVVESEQGLCSFTSDGTDLYYYDMDGYKLVRANTNGEFIEDLLEGFVKTEDPTPTSLGRDLEVYNGKLYFLDIWDEKSLHSYDPKTQANIRLTSNKVDNFSIIGDYIYLNTVSKLVDNDTYRFNLKTGGELEKINSNDGSDFISDGTYLYYAQNNASGAKTAIRRTNLTTLEDEEIYSKGVSNLRMVNGELAFIDGYQIFTMNLETFVATEIKPDGKSVHTTVFDTDGTSIYYRDMYGVGYLSKRLSKYNLSTETKVEMVEAKTDPISIVYHDGYVYYYTDTTTASANGLYKVAADVTSTITGTCVLACNSTYYATTFAFIGNDVYFLNYISAGLFGDSHIYKLASTGGEPVKVA